MKMMKNKYVLSATFAAASLLFACNNSSDYKSDKDSLSKVNAVIEQSNVDTNANKDGTGEVPVATTVAPADTAASSSSTTPAKTSTAKHNPAKKGHKGTVRIALYRPDYKTKMEADKNGVYNYTEVKPMYPGGEQALDKFIQDNIQYPQDAMDNGVEGTVTVTFAVDERGKVYSPKLKDQKLGYGLDDEALNVVGKMPKWTPGNIKGKNVKSYYNLPITFSLL